MLVVTKAVYGARGVGIVENYPGDVMNFRLAAENAAAHRRGRKRLRPRGYQRLRTPGDVLPGTVRCSYGCGGRVKFPVAISAKLIAPPSPRPTQTPRPDALDRHTHGLSSRLRSLHNAVLWALTRSRIWSLPRTSVSDGLMSFTATQQRRRGSLIADISFRRVLDIAREATAWIKLVHALVGFVPD